MQKFILLLIIFTATFANAASFRYSFDDNERIKATCSCPDSYPLMSEDGYCYSCDEAEVIKLADEDSCERICSGQNGTTKRISDFFGCKLEKCPENKPLEDSFGKCRSCKYDGPVSDTKNCSLCPNRKIQDGVCVIADCSDRLLLSAYGFCYPCSTGQSVETLRGKCTTVCPNRRESGSWSITVDGVKTSGVDCILKNDGDE